MRRVWRPSEDDPHELPAWSLPAALADKVALTAEWPSPVSREWAWGGSTGAGSRVCILDTGVERGHPLVGEVERSVVVREGASGLEVVDDEQGDVNGHGTACAGIVRSLAPEASLASVRVLAADVNGKAAELLTALEWAIEQRFEVISLSLATRRTDFAWPLQELTARAYFRHSVVVAAAHNTPVESYPWRFPAVVSVGSHEGTEPTVFFRNPHPPAEFFARGVNVEAAWPGGGRIRVTGNSFATPHLAGICALIMSKHPTLTPLQVKTVLSLTATNVASAA
jgi:subtilisin